MVDGAVRQVSNIFKLNGVNQVDIKILILYAFKANEMILTYILVLLHDRKFICLLYSKT